MDLTFTVSIQVFWWDGISVSAEPAAIEAPSAVLLEELYRESDL